MSMQPNNPPSAPPATGQQKRSRKVRGCAVAAILLVALCAILAGYREWALRQLAQEYITGHEALARGDCDTALRSFDRIIESSLGQDSADYPNAVQEKQECQDFQQATAAQQQGERAAALLAYRQFVSDHPQSALVAHVEQQVADMFAEAEPEALAEPELCADLDGLVEAGLIPEKDEELPLLYIACGAAYEANNDYLAAAGMYERIRSEYPTHSRLEEVEVALARVLIAEAQAAGAGELPAPQVSGGSNGGPTAVIIQNDTPEHLTLVFSGPEVRIEELEPCAECQEFEGGAPESCPKQGPVGEYALPPGAYDVLVRASSAEGVTPFKGEWDLQEGQEYYSCFYLVRE